MNLVQQVELHIAEWSYYSVCQKRIHIHLSTAQKLRVMHTDSGQMLVANHENSM